MSTSLHKLLVILVQDCFLNLRMQWCVGTLGLWGVPPSHSSIVRPPVSDPVYSLVPVMVYGRNVQVFCKLSNYNYVKNYFRLSCTGLPRINSASLSLKPRTLQCAKRTHKTEGVGASLNCPPSYPEVIYLIQLLINLIILYREYD